jgi:hypothetical protein
MEVAVAAPASATVEVLRAFGALGVAFIGYHCLRSKGFSRAFSLLGEEQSDQFVFNHGAY